MAVEYQPKMILAGYSGYSRFLDYQKFRDVADKTNSYLMADMSHIGGLVAANLVPQSPFDYCDIVTTTIHKTLRGPRAALLFFRKSVKKNPDLGTHVNNSIFPGHLGGPHNHTISAVATCLKQASSQEFKEYQKLVLRNSKKMAEILSSKGYKLVTGGTDNHMVMMSLEGFDVDGAQVEFVLEMADITVNKNTIKGDTSALRPRGMRIGSPAMTTRGCKEEDFELITEMVHEGVLLTKEFTEDNQKIFAFKKKVRENMKNPDSSILNLKKRVNEFSEKFEFNFNHEMI